VLNRDEILNNAKEESELSDLKQHADKMLRGFENFNNFSSNRAVWELVQNACDLTQECEVVIDYSNGFSFTHNGKPFTTKSLISLIKQVSGKYGDDSEIPEVGKYGTGFLTTHTFGRKFKINSVFEANATFFEIKDFEIDRSPKEWKPLSEKIKEQKENVYKLIKHGAIVPGENIKTTFTFIPETEQESIYIAESGKDLEDYIPIVLTINNRIKKITVIGTDKKPITFEKASKNSFKNEKSINLFQTTILRNGVNQTIYSIFDEKDEIEIILPINEKLELFEFPERVARLFLYYPLVGSEDFGFNYIINCNQFLPTEPRDGIHLKSNKDQVREQEEANRKIVEKASELIFAFLKSNLLSVKNPLLYAKINFKRNSENSLLNEYFEGLQNIWTNEFKTLPIVETSNSPIAITPKESCFFNEDLLNCIDCFEEIYELALIFNPSLPVKEIAIQWSKYAFEWSSDDVRFIGHEDLVASISKETLEKFNKTSLIKYYKQLVTDERINLFSDHPLLPNLEGKFSHLIHLLNPKDLTPVLIEMGKILIPISIERLIHPEFIFDFALEKFNRKDFSNAVKMKLDEMQASNLICIPETFNKDQYVEFEEKALKCMDFVFFENWLKFCKLNSNIKSQSKPSALIKIISRYYSLDDQLIHLPNLEATEENLEFRSTRKTLAQVFFNLLTLHNEAWVESNIPLITEIIECNEDSLKEIYASSKIYPNQLNNLKVLGDLKRDVSVKDEIKDLYLKVLSDDIKSQLIYRQFNELIPEDRFVTNKYLTAQIEDAFFTTDISNINEHQFKPEILGIIAKLRDKEYADMFPRLDDKKANLMLEIVTNENTKDDIFSIVTLKESQLKKLGLLVQNKNFEAILNQAAIAVQLEIESRADFRHKYEIGTYIEGVIRKKLSTELKGRITFDNKETLEANDVQGGQDIIVLLDGSPVFYIEVKSRWDSRNSVSMSKLQLQRAVEESEKYALCSVDITKYSGTSDKYKLSVDEIIPLTKFIRNIGDSIKPLIEDNLIAEKNLDESIHLIDYRGIIPQDIIKTGDEFEIFIESLTATINKIAIKV
jgi:hypothetical protein